MVYVYQNTEDEDQQANFNYFLRHGMDAEDGNSYVVIARELVRSLILCRSLCCSVMLAACCARFLCACVAALCPASDPGKCQAT